MEILREQIDQIDLSDVIHPNSAPMPPVHPGEILREDFMVPLALSPAQLAEALDIGPARLDGLMREEASITADMALRLGRYFQIGPEFWLGLQNQFDLACARALVGDSITRIIPHPVAAE